MKTVMCVCLGTLLLLALPFGLLASEPKTLVFSAIPDQDQSRLKSRFAKIAEYLAKELSIPVRYIPVKSYAATVTAFRNNQVQLAWFGGLSGVRARLLVPGSQAIVQGFEDQKFRSYFIAHHSTKISQHSAFPVAIQGKTFTFGSKGSTSGRLMPEYSIRKYFGKAPRKVFARVGFSNNHSRTIALVQSGAYQVGAVNYKVWEKEVKAGKIDPAKVSVIWQTPEYPDYQWTIRGDVDSIWGQGFTHRVQATLIRLSDPKLLETFPRSRFISTKNDVYQPILDTAKNIGLID